MKDRDNRGVYGENLCPFTGGMLQLSCCDLDRHSSNDLATSQQSAPQIVWCQISKWSVYKVEYKVQSKMCMEDQSRTHSREVVKMFTFLPLRRIGVFSLPHNQFQSIYVKTLVRCPETQLHLAPLLQKVTTSPLSAGPSERLLANDFRCPGEA